MMATVDMEDRKRRLDLESLGDPSAASKRPHLDRSTPSFASKGSPGIKQELQDSAVEGDESIPAYKSLEAYRKEAIYRHMREAKRDLQRSQDKVKNLQESLHSMDERCAAFNRFWNTLVEDVRLSIREEDFPAEHKSNLLQAVPLTTKKPAIAAFSESLQERNQSFKAVLSRIVSMGSRSQPEVDQLQARCHRLGEESASLRAQISLAISDKETLQEELSATIEQLRRAEKKFDRLHSSTVKAVEHPGAEAEEAAEQAKVEAANAEREAALQRKQAAEGEMQVENGDQPRTAVDGAINTEDLEEYKRLASIRLDECDRLREEFIALRQETERTKAATMEMIDSRLLDSKLYRELHQHFEEAKQQWKRFEGEKERLEAENAVLREMRPDFERVTKAEADAQVEGLRISIKTHEGDVARIRGMRDDLLAELNEKKQKEMIKSEQVGQMKALIRSKDKQITVLRSEVRRLQLTLAAKNGDAAMLARLRGAGKIEGDAQQHKEEEEVEMIEALQDRLQSAEQMSSDLKRQLEARSSSTSEKDLEVKVAYLQDQLDRLTAALGQATTDAAPSPDAVKAVLLTQSEDIQRLRRELAIAQESTTALCDELDKIGEAYNEAQKVAMEKVVDTAKMEERMELLVAGKARADQKYFKAMGSKDALESESKIMARNVERQANVIEQYKEVEKALRTQLSKGEAEVTQLRALVDRQSQNLIERERDVRLREQDKVTAEQAEDEARNALRKRDEEYNEESKTRLDLLEKNDRMQREIDRFKRQIASGASGNKKKGNGGDDSQIEYLNALLRCSACKDRYRDRIITRCLHTFCQNCVDARIQTRQRKCPHCGLGFSTSDVQTLYLQ